MSAPRYAYIISKNLDPVFAVFIGTSAAVVRINRDEKEKGKTTQDTMDALKRRVGNMFTSDSKPVTASTG